MTRLSVLFLFAIFTLVVAGQFGSSDISLLGYAKCWLQHGQCQQLELSQQIIWQIRVPRLLTGFAAGAGLTLAGSILQSVTRNPLADPYLFGIVSGAGLGAVLGGLVSSLLEVDLPFTLFAFAGATLAVLAVVLISSRHGWQRIDQILLAGVAISFLCSAITSLLLYFQNPHAANRILFWLMGSLAQSDWQSVQVILPMVLLTSVIIQALARKLDALLLTDDAIHALGISLVQLRLLLMLLVAAISAVVVSFCGGIGFVGLMIPHLVRHFVGSSHAVSNIACLLIGGSFLVWVDVLARILIPDQEIPIGIITAALGSLFFIGLMAKRVQT